MEVVDVDAVDAEVFEAAAELIFEEARRHAVAAADDVVRSENARLDVLAIKIIVGVGGHGAVGRKVAALGADHEFFASVALLQQILDGGADAAFAALKAIVDGGVDDVDASFDGGGDAGGVGLIGFIAGRAEVGADADRREYEAMRFAEVAVGGAAGKTLGVSGGACGGGGCGHCGLFPWFSGFARSEVLALGCWFVAASALFVAAASLSFGNSRREQARRILR